MVEQRKSHRRRSAANTEVGKATCARTEVTVVRARRGQYGQNLTWCLQLLQVVKVKGVVVEVTARDAVNRLVGKGRGDRNGLTLGSLSPKSR